jgi:hypothetical protein
MQPPAWRLFCAACAAAGWLTAVSASAEDLPAPDVAPARHFRFIPDPGTAWYLEHSTDGQTWQDLAGPFFANGGAIDHFQPGAAVKGVSQRLRFVDPATIGQAPVSVAGHSFMMENGGEPVRVHFMNEVRGIVRIDAMHARSFTYTWKKTSPDEAEAVLSGLDGSFTLLRLHFSGPQLGRWGMEDIPSPQAAALVRETRDSGAFSFRRGLFARSIEHASLPTDLPGRTIVFNEAGKLTKLEFPDATSVVMTSPRGGRIQGT